MPVFKVKGKKEVEFHTLVEADNTTIAINKVCDEGKDFVWIADKNNAITDGTDLQIMGCPDRIAE